jgi:hypothetical protein
MSTRRRVLLSGTAVLFLVAAMTLPAAGQGGRGGGAGVESGRGAGVPPAGPIPRRADGKPDLTGRWDGGGGVLHNTVILEDHPGGFGIQAGGSLIIDPKDGVIPYQPWALAERNRRREDANGYEDQVGHCEFYDIARVVSFPMEIAYSGNDIVISPNQHITRYIDMTRRQHLPAGIRLWLGDPIGQWEGDTLVIDITNLAGKTRMALGGDFYSADAHIVEKFRMVDANTINWTMTFDDPKVYTRPWTMTSHEPMKRVRQGDGNFDVEDTCHEGNVDLVHLKNVYDQTHGKVPWPPVYPDGPQGRWGGGGTR